MGEVVRAMEVMVVQALVEVMNLALVLVLVEQDSILVGEDMGAVVVTILTQDSFMIKLCSRICMQV